MASGKTPDGNGSRPKASDFGRRPSDSTDPTAGASSDEIIPGPGDSTNPNATAPRTTWKLLALHGPRSGGEFPLEADEITLGRGTDNGITIPDVSVSRHHVRFEREGDAFAVVDLKSGNGTKVNGERQERAVLQHGDEIALGDTVLQMLNVALPLPERYRGAPPLVPTKKAAPAPPADNHSTPPRASAPATAAVTDTAPSSTPAAPPPPVLPPAAKKKAGNSRMPLYGAIFVAMMIVFGVKYYVDQKKSGGTAEKQKTNDLIERVRQRARDRQWTEALATLVHEGPAKADDTIQKWTNGVRAEATAQSAYEKASNALLHGDYKVALDVARAVEPETDFGEDAQTKIIDRMPEILANALVDARAALRAGDHDKCMDIVNRVLQASPTNADALTARAECPYKAPPPPPARDAGPAPVVDAGPQGPVNKCYGPAVTQYLQDRVDEAIKLAGKTVIPTCQNLEQMLIEFSNHRARGQEAAQNKRIPEAAKEFDLAVAIDDKIAEGRFSAPGRQVREQLSRMEYFLALDAKGDDQLANKARHLRAAVKANPENDLAKKELEKCYDRAREMFQEAYQMKAGDKEGAIRLFRIVVGTLPDSDEKKAKAKNWIEQLSGPKK